MRAKEDLAGLFQAVTRNNKELITNLVPDTGESIKTCEMPSEYSELRTRYNYQEEINDQPKPQEFIAHQEDSLEIRSIGKTILNIEKLKS